MKEEIPKILIVDDIIMNVEIMKNIIESRGYIALCAQSVQEAVEYFKTEEPSLILSDWSMPEIDGMQFCHMVKNNADTKDIPFIFISVLDTAEEKKMAFEAGAVDFINKPFDPTEVIMRVDNHLNSYRIKQEMENYNRMLHTIVERQQMQLEQEQERVLSVLIRVMERLSRNLGGNLKNLGRNCSFLTQSMQMLPEYANEITDEFADAIGEAVRLYDIENFLEGLANSTEPESENKEHINAGFLEELAQGGKSRTLSMAHNIARYRFARWDGTGYPQLAGKEIPLEARITALVEDFDQMTESDGTGDAKGAVKRIDEGSGSLYDPDIVKVFDKVWQQIAIT